MKRILYFFYLMLLFLIVTACNRFPDPDFLTEKGGLSVIIVHPHDSIMESPEFLSNHTEHNVFRITQYNFNTINDIYPSFNIESAPYFIFSDSKGIAYETADLEDAEDFYKNNVNKKSINLNHYLKRSSCQIKNLFKRKGPIFYYWFFFCLLA